VISYLTVQQQKINEIEKKGKEQTSGAR